MGIAAVGHDATCSSDLDEMVFLSVCMEGHQRDDQHCLTCLHGISLVARAGHSYWKGSCFRRCTGNEMDTTRKGTEMKSDDSGDSDDDDDDDSDSDNNDDNGYNDDDDGGGGGGDGSTCLK